MSSFWSPPGDKKPYWTLFSSLKIWSICKARTTSTTTPFVVLEANIVIDENGEWFWRVSLMKLLKKILAGETNVDQDVSGDWIESG